MQNITKLNKFSSRRRFPLEGHGRKGRLDSETHYNLERGFSLPEERIMEAVV